MKAVILDKAVFGSGSQAAIVPDISWASFETIEAMHSWSELFRPQADLLAHAAHRGDQLLPKYGSPVPSLRTSSGMTLDRLSACERLNGSYWTSTYGGEDVRVLSSVSTRLERIVNIDPK